MPTTKSTYERLYLEHGEMVSGQSLVKLAGFTTSDALRTAYHRGAVGFHVFRINGRRGFFAYTSEVAKWLESLNPASPSLTPSSPSEADMT